MKCFVLERPWAPLVASVVVVSLSSFIDTNAWMYAILYPVFALWWGWPFLAERNLRGLLGGGRSKGSR